MVYSRTPALAARDGDLRPHHVLQHAAQKYDATQAAHPGEGTCSTCWRMPASTLTLAHDNDGGTAKGACDRVPHIDAGSQIMKLPRDCGGRVAWITYCCTS